MLSSDHIVTLVLLLALLAKFAIFENKDEIDERLREASSMSPIRNKGNSQASAEFYLLLLLLAGKEYIDKQSQTDPKASSSTRELLNKQKRTLAECLQIYRANEQPLVLTDEEIMLLVDSKHIAPYQIEKVTGDPTRAVNIRRRIVGNAGDFEDALQGLPFENYDYSKVIFQLLNVLKLLNLRVRLGRLLFFNGDTYPGCTKQLVWLLSYVMVYHDSYLQQ